MNVTQKIKMDLLSKQNVQTIYAVRDDTNSRLVQISLFEGGVPWEVPLDATIAIGYRSENGASGVYDTLPNGENASIYDGNQITISLVPASLYAGTTKVTVSISDKNGNQISTFPLNVEVDENYSYGASEPETYINLRQWLSVALSDIVLGGSGLSENAKTLLLTILRNGVYVSDQSENIAALEQALKENSGGDSDDSDEEESVIIQTGGTLYIVSGVTVAQAGSTLTFM
jgi:hypothetical protein